MKECCINLKCGGEISFCKLYRVLLEAASSGCSRILVCANAVNVASFRAVICWAIKVVTASFSVAVFGIQIGGIRVFLNMIGIGSSSTRVAIAFAIKMFNCSFSLLSVLFSCIAESNRKLVRNGLVSAF